MVDQQRSDSAVNGLVSALLEQLPTVAATGNGYHPGATGEVLADLRALHGCLNSAAVLLEPVLADLRGLAAPAAPAGNRKGATTPCETPDSDRAEQQQPTEPDTTAEFDATGRQALETADAAAREYQARLSRLAVDADATLSEPGEQHAPRSGRRRRTKGR